MKLNRLRTPIVVGVLALLMVGVVIRAMERARHRRYVDQWVHSQHRMDTQATPEQSHARIREALLSDKAWAIELLGEDLRRADSYVQILWRFAQSHGLGGYVPWLRGGNRAESYRFEATKALRLLGTNGVSAVPTLWKNLDHSISRYWDLERTETAITLAVIEGGNSETISRLGQLTNNRGFRAQLAGWVLTAAFNPTNSMAREEVRRRLMPAEETPLPALTVGYILGEIGRPGASLTPMVRLAVARTYLSWTVPGLARMAHSVWMADGNPDLALQVVHRVWQEFVQELGPNERPAGAGPGTQNSRQTVYQMATILGSIPEVAKELRPLLTSMPTGDVERDMALRCLEPVGRE